MVYGICVQREEKRILVVFRGTISHNWIINMKYDTSRVSNPVIDKYPGRKELLGIHTGFSIHVTPKEGTFYYRSFHGSSS